MLHVESSTSCAIMSASQSVPCCSANSGSGYLPSPFQCGKSLILPTPLRASRDVLHIHNQFIGPFRQAIIPRSSHVLFIRGYGIHGIERLGPSLAVPRNSNYITDKQCRKHDSSRGIQEMGPCWALGQRKSALGFFRLSHAPATNKTVAYDNAEDYEFASSKDLSSHCQTIRCLGRRLQGRKQ